MHSPNLLTLAREYVAVVAHCRAGQLGRPVRGDRYALDKALVCRLLDKNKYEDAAAKLKLWKALGWIDAEDPHVTRRVRGEGSEKMQRKIVIDLPVHETLTRLIGVPTG